MFSRPLAFVLLALATLTAAAGGAYVANRNNARESAAVATPAAATQPASAATPSTSPAAQPVAETEAAVTPAPPPAPQFEELILPASSVISLQMESTLTSERARVEDRVDARVTRDVLSGGRVAIPAGSRVLGSVTEVERGGKVKERARLGVR